MTRDIDKCLLSVLTGVRIERVKRKIYQLFVGTKEAVRYIRGFVLSGCPTVH